MDEIVSTFCRLCTAYCPIEVEIVGAKPVRISGDRNAPLYGGYTCVKGRALPQIHSNPNRLLGSLKRGPNGDFVPVASDVAIEEISSRLSELVRLHGPRSIAVYMSTPTGIYPATAQTGVAFMGALGSPLIFSAVTIDQSGLNIANAMHGEWGGGRPAHDAADLILIAGGNPVISKQYMSQNPARRLKDQVNAGAKLMVIDPRRTETARRAHLHLQIRPGEDASVLAGMIHLLLKEQALDEDFIRENVEGLDALRAAVAPFDPQMVSRRAGIPPEQLIEAASLIATARQGYFAGGTGLGMSGHANLTFYLLLCLQSLRGFWPRAGEPFAGSSVLNPPTRHLAQAFSPKPPNLPDRLSVTGLPMSVAGMPTSALPDEILSSSEDRIRALICLGNPISCWPDAAKAEEAMCGLELLVVPNVEMFGTTKLAHYVIATKNILETPATTQFIESVRPVHHGYGWEQPYAHHTPALLPCPEGSDLMEEWQFFYRVARRMGLQIRYLSGTGLTAGDSSSNQGLLDMENEPTTEEVFDILCQGSAIALDEVRRRRRPSLYPEAQQTIEPREDGWIQKFQVGDSRMMEELRVISAADVDKCDHQFPFRLIPRRADHVLNSAYREFAHKKKYNPAFMHPEDLRSLGVSPGTLVQIRSAHGVIQAIADADDGLRQGVLSMTHGFGADPDSANDPFRFGSNVNYLLNMVDGRDEISGMPVMSAIPVDVSAL